MRILAPFSRVEEVEPLVDSGADELYCGIIPSEWESSYGCFDGLNRREGSAANLADFDSLEESVRIAHRKNARVFLALNGFFTDRQYPLLQKILVRLQTIPLDAYIVADVGLLQFLCDSGNEREIHVGTGATVLNSHAAAVLARMRVARVVLERHMNLEEIRLFQENNRFGVEVEVFILNTLCPYVDGFCTFYHGVGPSVQNSFIRDRRSVPVKVFTSYDPHYQGHGCGVAYQRTLIPAEPGEVLPEPAPPPEKNRSGAQKPCGVCALYDFKAIGITALKIVERSMPKQSKVNDTRFVRTALNILRDEPAISKPLFIQKVRQLYCRTYGYTACDGYSCYYPSVFSDRQE